MRCIGNQLLFYIVEESGSHPVQSKVTSSCLCKQVEGASLPFQVKSLEDGVDDTVDAFYVHKANHGPGAAADFDKTTLDHVGGAPLAPQGPGKGAEPPQST